MYSIHSSFKRFVPRLNEIWLFIVNIVSIITGKRFRKVLCCTASSENRIDPLSGDRPSPVEMTDSSDRDDEIFDSPLVQSIRQKHATIEKISDYMWEDMENQDPEDVF
jgi:hypothetical protein